MPAIACSILTFYRFFLPEEQTLSYENKLQTQSQVDQERTTFGISYFQEMSTSGLIEYNFYVADTPEILNSYFTTGTAYNTRRNWIKAFSVQCGNIITFNNPVTTIEVVTNINDYVIATMNA